MTANNASHSSNPHDLAIGDLCITLAPIRSGKIPIGTAVTVLDFAHVFRSHRIRVYDSLGGLVYQVITADEHLALYTRRGLLKITPDDSIKSELKSESHIFDFHKQNSTVVRS